jgi:ubiquitin-protein ligase
MAAAKRIAKELRELWERIAAGDPWACGLAIAPNQDDIFDWLCTYTCPQHYVYQGRQRVSPYAGFIIRFRIQFPTDYPFKPFKLLTQRTFDFFHPLIACAPDTGLCAAFIHRVHLFEEDGPRAWSPGFSVRKLLEEGLLPMWTDGDRWVAEQAKMQTLPNLYCPRFAQFLDDEFEAKSAFPHDLPCYQGDLVPFLEQRAQAEAADEAARLSRAAKESEILAEEAAAVSKREASFEIIASTIDRNVRIQVYPSFRIAHLQQVISDATGIPVYRIKYIDFLEKMKRFDCNNDMRLSDLNIQAGSCVHVSLRSCACRAYTTTGFNPAAAHLLLTDVQRFERFARRSCFAQRLPLSMVHLISRLSSIVLPRPLSLQLQPRVSSLLPLLWFTDVCQMLVLSGWTVGTLRVLFSESQPINRWDAQTLVLCVRRRVLGGAGVLRLAGCDQSAAPPPGTRASGFGCGPQSEMWGS